MMDDCTDQLSASSHAFLSQDCEVPESKLDVPDENNLDENSSTLERLAVLLRLSYPVVISFFLSISGSFVNLIFAGHYEADGVDPKEVFSGIALTSLFINVSCYSILIGMSSAVETLGSQYNGAENFKEVGIILQRSKIYQ